MRIHHWVVAVVSSVISANNVSHALLPPLSPAELDQQADLVVVGTVENTVALGKPYKDHCYEWRNYQASFRVDKRTKGKSSERIQLRYPTRIDSHAKCVGGRTSYSLRKGGMYRLHLARRFAKSKNSPVYYTFINWAGVKSIERK